jgi:hypothetical protein
VTTSSGAFCGVNTTYSTSVTPQKAPEEVVIDGYEGAIIMCSVVRDDPVYYNHMTKVVKLLLTRQREKGSYAGQG